MKEIDYLLKGCWRSRISVFSALLKETYRTHYFQPANIDYSHNLPSSSSLSVAVATAETLYPGREVSSFESHLVNFRAVVAELFFDLYFASSGKASLGGTVLSIITCRV